jgi:hypothetical protein
MLQKHFKLKMLPYTVVILVLGVIFETINLKLEDTHAFAQALNSFASMESHLILMVFNFSLPRALYLLSVFSVRCLFLPWCLNLPSLLIAT